MRLRIVCNHSECTLDDTYSSFAAQMLVCRLDELQVSPGVEFRLGNGQSPWLDFLGCKNNIVIPTRLSMPNDPYHRQQCLERELEGGEAILYLNTKGHLFSTSSRINMDRFNRLLLKMTYDRTCPCSVSLSYLSFVSSLQLLWMVYPTHVFRTNR